MTKPREAGSVEAAVFDCLRALGDNEAAALCGVSRGYLWQCSDPENPRCLRLDRALKLDAAMRAAGYGTPIFDACARQLSAAPSGRAGDCPMTAIAALTAELGVVAATVKEAWLDRLIDAAECRQIQTVIDRLVSEAAALRETVEPKVIRLV